jgi:riboflavin kinase/FMN adenylyltransferase
VEPPLTQTEHNPPLTALTIGNFDGVHLGHAELIRRGRLAVGPDGRLVALAFHPNPLTVIKPAAAPAALTTFDQRVRLLQRAGADEVLHLSPTRKLLSTDPFTFIHEIVERWQPAVIVEGSDFRFGARRAGDVDTLAQIGSQLDRLGRGFETIVLDPVNVSLSDGRLLPASSTLVRWLLERGRVADAARVLGRPHRVEGLVVRGDQRGRTIGVPTANVESPNLLPGDAVYAGVARLPDGSSKPAAIHVGPRETFGSSKRTLEVFVLDWRGPGTLSIDDPAQYAYGWTMKIDFLAWLRDQARYDSVDGLLAQMERDIARSRRLAAAYESQPGTTPLTPAAAVKA